MSHIAIVGAATGTGTFSIAAPAGSTDRTLTLPDSAGTLATAESVAAAGYTTLAAVAAVGYTTSAGVLSQFNATGSAPVYACRAWVNFNGTGTVAIRASGNVSSITDNGTGDYTVNFATAMPDANYSCVMMGGHKSIIWGLPIFIGQSGHGHDNSHSNIAVRFGTTGPNDVLYDGFQVNVAIFR